MTNKEIEQYYFGMFCRHYRLPPGQIVHKDKPDVILQGSRKIGIEITNFYLEKGGLPESEQVQRKAREAVVSEAQQMYLQEKGKRIELSLSFDKVSPIRDRRRLARRIANIGHEIDGRTTGEIGSEVYEDIPELSFVWLNAKEYEDAKWRVVQIHSTPLMSVDNLQEIVRVKETQSKEYIRCDAYWLLVVVDFWDRAQDQEINIEGTVDSSVFEKVIVYKTQFGHVLEAK